ncbi:MAG: tryptophan--tRNA ligase, partial [Chloroflexi bacterium]|nr:tryptophan--tRNA ligase [Chloroflexota bacterium]
MKRIDVLSCIQPTSEMHVGNYFGAVKNWVDLQATNACAYGVVDLHAMTMPYQPERLRENTMRMMLELVACGLDPERTVLFVQSLVPEHTELAWILGCVAAFGDLTRMTQFKDKSGRVEAEVGAAFISAGLFTYPVLQAADILVYRAHKVPVGKDQDQHLELSRSVARRFNETFAPVFPEPKPLYTETPKIMSLASPEQKMSKSLGAKHYVGLFEDADSIRAKVRSAVTDSGPPADGAEVSPGVANLLEILKACGREAEAAAMTEEYFAGRLRYVHLKDAVAAALIDLSTTLRARRDEIASRLSIEDLIYDAS